MASAADGSSGFIDSLSETICGPVASLTADGAYDQDGVYDQVAAHYPEASVIIPLRSSAVPSETAQTAPAMRDRHSRTGPDAGTRASRVHPPAVTISVRWPNYDRLPTHATQPQRMPSRQRVADRFGKVAPPGDARSGRLKCCGESSMARVAASETCAQTVMSGRHVRTGVRQSICRARRDPRCAWPFFSPEVSGPSLHK